MTVTPDSRSTEVLWTIDQLGDVAANAMAQVELPQSNGQVREVPRKRTIRYYTTLGLLDRPAQMKGRTALYSWRHLEQLVAIKRLQQQGLPLREVQEQLAGLGHPEVRALADLPEAVYGGLSARRPTSDDDTVALPPAPNRRVDFWAAEATEPSGIVAGVTLDDDDWDEAVSPVENEASDAASRSLDPARPEAQMPRLRSAVEVAPGLIVLLPAELASSSESILGSSDLEALRTAAAPLVDALKQRGLLASRESVPARPSDSLEAAGPARARPAAPADPDANDANPSVGEEPDPEGPKEGEP